MHERYGFIAEIFAFIYGLFGWKRMCIAIGFEVLTLITYTRYLFGSTIAYLYPLTGIMLVLILFVGYDLYQQMQKEKACKRSGRGNVSWYRDQGSRHQTG